MGYIYRITNILNGKSYIGETKQVDVQSRWNNHIKSIETKNGATALIGALEKYGQENFKFEVLIICFDEDRLYYEVEYIKKLNTLVPHGYNISKGRVDVSEYSVTDIKSFIKEKKARASEYRTKVKNLSTSISEKMKNSEKWIKAVEEKRVGNKDRKHNEETKKKIAESVHKYFQNVNSDKKSANIEKHREAMAKAKGKVVEQYTLDNKFLNKYPSICAAARATKLSRITIQLNLYGKADRGGDYIWRYA